MSESEEFLRSCMNRANLALKNAATLEQVLAIDYQMKQNFKIYKSLKQKEDGNKQSTEVSGEQDNADNSEDPTGSPDNGNTAGGSTRTLVTNISRSDIA